MPMSQHRFVERAAILDRHRLVMLVKADERAADNRRRDFARQLQRQRGETILVGRLGEALIDVEQK